MKTVRITHFSFFFSTFFTRSSAHGIDSQRFATTTPAKVTAQNTTNRAGATPLLFAVSRPKYRGIAPARHAERRVSTTLRQVLTEFSERFSFPQGNFAPGSLSNDDRQLGRPTASPLFLFHLPLPTGSGSGVGTGLLIQTALGRTGGLGALRTKRSG